MLKEKDETQKNRERVREMKIKERDACCLLAVARFDINERTGVINICSEKEKPVIDSLVYAFVLK